MQIARYGIPYSFDVWKRLTGNDAFEYHVGWYQRPATLDNQANSSLRDYILTHKEEWTKEKTIILVGHMGYVDRELMDLSSYTLYRLNDLAGVTDPEVIQWVRETQWS